MVHVKICGLRTAEHALAAVEAGADMLGFILAPSRRQIQPDELASIARAVRAAPRGGAVRLAGVFVNEHPDRIAQVVDACGLDIVQLSGDETPDVLERLPRSAEIMKTVRLTGAAAERPWLEGRPGPPWVRLHVDAHVPGSYGGAGVVADWERAAAYARELDLLLAGGLGPDNVAEAIRRVRPWGVDVSSGVETGGVKDSAKIRAFVAAARQP